MTESWARTKMALQPAQLVAMSEGPNILLDKPIMLIGRHQECDIQIPSRKISRRHCCIAQVNDYFVVRDLCSTNGIRINGMRVQEGLLKTGDELTIGNFRYQIQPLDGAAIPVKKATRHKDESLEMCDDPVALEEPDAPLDPVNEQPASVRFPDNSPLAPHSDSGLKHAK